MSSLGVTSDEFLYIILLVISIVSGYIVKYISNPHYRKWICTALGLIMILTTSRLHIIHPIFSALVNSVIIFYTDKRCIHILSFIFSFGYLFFFRTIHYFGLPSPLATTNAVQLILTLKMTSLAFDIHDSFELKKQLKKEEDNKDSKAENTKLSLQYQETNPCFADTLHYYACNIGIFTGPFFRYRVYHDMIYNHHSASIPTVLPMLKRIRLLPLFGFCFFIGNKFFPHTALETDEFYLQPFWFRLFYMIPIFFVFRMRFYVGWNLAEAAFMTSALGAYPVTTEPKIGVGPSKLEEYSNLKGKAPEEIEYNFETIHNINEYECEFQTTVRGVLHYWNKSVQFWLAYYVYKRVPAKSLRTYITLFVSSYWHGIYAGYYLGLLSVPLMMVAERHTENMFYHSASPLQQQIYPKIAWFFRVRAFDYMCIGFLMLTGEKTLRYWRSIYFCGHIFAIICIISGLLYKMSHPKKKHEAEKFS